MPAMRSKVEIIKDVKTGKKPDLKIVLAVGDVALLVEPCELKEGDKEQKFLLKQINPKSEFNGHKYKVKASHFKPWVDPSIPPPPPPPPVRTGALPYACSTSSSYQHWGQHNLGQYGW